MKCKLSDICEFVKGKVAVANLTNANYISTENMLPNRGGIVAATSLPSADITQIYADGDILVSNIRPYFKKIWFATTSGGCSNDVLVFRAKENVNPFYLYYILSDDSFFNYATVTSKGTKMPRGDKIAIMNYEIEKHTRSEQDAIALILRPIDEKIALNREINNNLEQQAATLVNQYLISTEGTAILSDIIDFVNGFAFQSSTYLPMGQYKIITIKNVQDGKIDSAGSACIDEFPPRMKANCILHIGDVLLSLTGNVGRIGIVCENKLLLNQRVAKIAPHNPALLPLLYFILRQPTIKTQMEAIAKGTAQLNLSPVETLKLQIPFEISSASVLSDSLRPMYNAIICNNQQNIVLASLRNSLLPKLMSGEIDVSDIRL